MEAGIGTLTRLGNAVMDAVLVVVEPTPRSIDVGQRAYELARDHDHGRVVIVANRVVDDADTQRIRAAFPGADVWPVPADEAIVDAEREGVAPIDSAPASAAVRSLSALATMLLG